MSFCLLQSLCNLTGLALLTLRANYSICLVLFVHSFDIIDVRLLVCYRFNVHLLSVEMFLTVCNCSDGESYICGDFVTTPVINCIKRRR